MIFSRLLRGEGGLFKVKPDSFLPYAPVHCAVYKPEHWQHMRVLEKGAGGLSPPTCLARICIATPANTNNSFCRDEMYQDLDENKLASSIDAIAISEI